MKKIIILSIFLIGILSFIILFNIKPSIELDKDLTVSINDKITNKEKIKKIKNGKILTKEENIDTSKIGKIKINLKLQNKFNKKFNYSYEIEVLDKISPVITCESTIEVTIGKTIDLIALAKVTDNYDEKIDVTIEGEYDLKKEGEYKLFYVAKDSSNNETKKEFLLKVKKDEKNVKPNTIDKAFKTSKGYSGVVKNGATYIDGVLIANKTYSLPSNYGSGLTKETNEAFKRMKDSASKDGINIYIASGFRSYNTQKTLYNNYVARDGKKEADTYSARAGHSEHQTGLAFDVCSSNSKACINSGFDNTKEAKWLSENASKFGFILRYPKGSENETGYMYESWHFRYVGKELASKLYNNGNWITLENYFGITSKYE